MENNKVDNTELNEEKNNTEELLEDEIEIIDADEPTDEGADSSKPKKRFRLISFKTKRDAITSIIIIAAAIVVVVAAINIVKILGGYQKGDSVYHNLGQLATSEETVNGKKTLKLDFEALKAVCPNAVGWIYLQDEISYPVVLGTDNSYYLTHLYDGTENREGTLFVDYRQTDGLESYNAIIYGHNMQNGSMFGHLIQYKDVEFFDTHRSFEVYVGPVKYEYKVFSVFVTGDESDVYTLSFANEVNYGEYLANCKAMSIYETDVTPTTKDKIMTLSTCTGADDSGERLIVQLVRGNQITDAQNATVDNAEL